MVDEIQNLVLAKGANRKELIDFFTDLENMPGLSSLKIGTYKSRHLLTEFYSARRAVNLLPPIWDRMAKDEEWTEFCKMLCEIQFTRTQIPYSEELSNLLYDISQGILDFAVKAYLFSQMRAIHNGLETISLNLIASVVIDHFKPAEKILAAIRDNDTQALANVDDVVIDFEAVYQGYITKSSRKKAKEEAKPIPENKANDDLKENNKAPKRQSKKAKQKNRGCIIPCWRFARNCS